jgi:hypothetical protein
VPRPLPCTAGCALISWCAAVGSQQSARRHAPCTPHSPARLFVRAGSHEQKLGVKDKDLKASITELKLILAHANGQTEYSTGTQLYLCGQSHESYVSHVG